LRDGHVDYRVHRAVDNDMRSLLSG
jgi:hypothetical protein